VRALAKEIITTAAIAAGMTAASIMDKPAKQSALLPTPRLEIEMMPQDIKRQPRRFARLPGVNPATHVTHRWRTHNFSLQVRVEIRADNEEWLEQFFKIFILGLPGKTADAGGNLVTVRPYRAERGGFESKMVEVFVKRSIPVWITFAGGLYRDDQVPLITDINIKDGVSVA